MTTRQSPTVRRRRLGAELRKRREHAGITLEFVAERMECSQSKISRIETGHSSVTSRDVRDMLTIYGTPTDEVDVLVEIAKEARQKGWWHPYSSVLVGAYVGLEAAASSIRAYEQQVVPGLLQISRVCRGDDSRRLAGLGRRSDHESCPCPDGPSIVAHATRRCDQVSGGAR